MKNPLIINLSAKSPPHWLHVVVTARSRRLDNQTCHGLLCPTPSETLAEKMIFVSRDLMTLMNCYRKVPPELKSAVNKGLVIWCNFK